MEGQEKNTAAAQETTEATRTFTQDEVNAIVGKRLAEERAKYPDYDALKEKAGKFDEMEEAQKTELQKAQDRAQALQSELESLKKEKEIRGIRDKVAGETGVPVRLLTGGTEEECMEQAKAIKEYAAPSSYPQVRDGGEPQHFNGASTREKFKEWYEANIRT